MQQINNKSARLDNSQTTRLSSDVSCPFDEQSGSFLNEYKLELGLHELKSHYYHRSFNLTDSPHSCESVICYYCFAKRLL